MVSNAPRFNEALRMFTNWCLGTDDDVIVYAWSGTDYNQVSREMLLKGYEMTEAEEKILGCGWSDFQYEFDSQLGIEKATSLKMALEMAGITFTGHEHDALDDARNTALLLQVFRDKELFDITLEKIRKALKPVPMSCALGELIDFSAFLSA